MSNSIIESNGDEKERIRRMLREAFSDVSCPDSFKQAESCGPMTHDVCLELRKDFYHYEPEEIHYMLPSILEDLMDTHTGDDIETENAEFLVFQLNPCGTENKIVREVRLKQFAGFTQRQAQAICEWLRMALTWQDLSLFIQDVEAAFEYWCQRASK